MYPGRAENLALHVAKMEALQAAYTQATAYAGENCMARLRSSISRPGWLGWQELVEQLQDRRIFKIMAGDALVSARQQRKLSELLEDKGGAKMARVSSFRALDRAAYYRRRFLEAV
ncbi:MAG: hypothetical protein AAFM92_03075 [Pseudomonadota bacterium]